MSFYMEFRIDIGYLYV